MLYTAIREVQMKTTKRYNLSLVRMAIIIKAQITYAGESVELHSWWECRLVQPVWKRVWRFFKKLKIELPCDTAIPLLGIYPEKTETVNSKRYMHPDVHSNTVYDSQDMKTT